MSLVIGTLLKEFYNIALESLQSLLWAQVAARRGAPMHSVTFNDFMTGTELLRGQRCAHDCAQRRL